MIKIIAIIFFVSTLIFASLFSIVIKDNAEIGIKNYECQKDIEMKRQLISASTDVLKECKAERFEWRAYFGGLYGLEQARKYYNAPAEAWEDILAEDLATSTDE